MNEGETPESTVMTVRIGAGGRVLGFEEPGTADSRAEKITMRGLKGVKQGKQVDAELNRLGVGFDGLAGLKRRAFGREANVLSTIRAIRDLDAVASQATWNYLRLLNPGFDCKAVVVNAVGEEQDEKGAAQAYLNGLMTRIGEEYGGGGDAILNVLDLSLLTNGAVAGEVSPVAALNDVEDWYPVDPPLITFRRDESNRLVMGQVVNGAFVELPSAQVFYQPLDTDVDDPYGRPPFLSVIQAVMARAMMLNDMRAFAHQAGYPRIDVKVLWDIVQRAAPPQLRESGKEVEFQKWAENQLNRLVAEYRELAVDDTFVHYDWLEVSLVPGSGLSFDFVALDNVLQRQLNSGLKMLPILLGINESASETHGSVQWQIQIAGVKALQRPVKRLFEKMANASLEIAGFAPTIRCRVTYDDQRTVDRLYEAQAELFEAQNLKLEVEMGWRTNDEASEMRTGHKAVAEPGEQSSAQLAADKAALTAVTAAETPQGQQPTATEKQQQASASWQLLWTTLGRAAAIGPPPHRSPENTLDGEELDQAAKKYGDAAEALFLDEVRVVVDLLVGEGWQARVARASAKEIADSAFGLAYRREMKRLLRQAIEDGMEQAGLPGKAPGRIVRRIWKENDQFVTKMRDDMKSQIRQWSDAVRAGENIRTEVVAEWFQKNAYRERMMGEFLAKQGFAAGWTGARTGTDDQTAFRWTLGPVKTEHCEDCQGRSGQVYTHDQLLRIGMPGSHSLACMSNCKCSVVAVSCSKKQMASGRLAKRVIDWAVEEAAELAALEAKLKADPEQSAGEACAVRGAEVAESYVRTIGSNEALKRIEVGEYSAEDAEGAERYIDWRSQTGKPHWYQRMNGLLRGQDDPRLQELLDPEAKAASDKLRAAMARSTVKQPTLAYRGTGTEIFEESDPRKMIGQVFTDKGFVSTALEEDNAIGHYAKWTIKMPPGTHGVPIDKAGVKMEYISQTEFVLPPGTRLRIDSAVETVHGIHSEYDIVATVLL